MVYSHYSKLFGYGLCEGQYRATLMAFGRYKGANSFDSSPADAGSTILRLTNKILADLQVDSKPRPQSNALGVVRDARSNSDPVGGVHAAQRGGPHPAYYDLNTILQPAVRQ